MKSLSDTVAGLIATVADLSKKVAELTVAIHTHDDLKSKFVALSAEVSEIRAAVAAGGGCGSVQTQTVDPTFVTKPIRDEIREIYKRDKSKDNIIIRGIPQTNFRETFEEILHLICPEITEPILSEVVHIKTNLSRAKVHDVRYRSQLLINSKKLDSSQNSSVYNNRDLTYCQRQDLRNRKRSRGAGQDAGD